jgi:hypothetical protein
MIGGFYKKPFCERSEQLFGRFMFYEKALQITTTVWSS